MDFNGGMKDFVTDNMFKEGFITARLCNSRSRIANPGRKSVLSRKRACYACNAVLAETARGLRSRSSFNLHTLPVYSRTPRQESPRVLFCKSVQKFAKILNYIELQPVLFKNSGEINVY